MSLDKTGVAMAALSGSWDRNSGPQPAKRAAFRRDMLRATDAIDRALRRLSGSPAQHWLTEEDGRAMAILSGMLGIVAADTLAKTRAQSGSTHTRQIEAAIGALREALRTENEAEVAE